MSPRLAPPPSPVVDQVYRLRLSAHRSWRAARNFALNCLGASLLLLELNYQIFLSIFGLENTVLYYVVLGLFIVFLLNAAVDLVKYVLLKFSTSCPEMNEMQRRLLAVNENEFAARGASPGGHGRNQTSPVFTLSSSRPASVVPTYTPPPTMSRSFSRSMSYSPSYVNSSISPAGHHSRSMTSPVYANTSGAPNYGNSSGHFNSSNPRSFMQPNPSPFSSPHDSFGLETLTLQDSPLRNRLRRTSPNKSDLMSMKDLDEFLRDEDRKERDRSIRQEEFMSHPYGQRYAMDVPHFPYQIACRSPQNVSALADDDSTDTVHGEEIWRRLGVSQTALEIWIEKLRRFFSQTIMSRVSKEIKKLNKQLRRLGLDEMEIGEVSIPTLKQIATTKGHQLQTLNSVIQFLDITSNQQYLVARIHELGKGGCMSDFNWNGGMEFKSKAWAEHLPTDCAIVMHCLCTYLDARLPPHPKFPDGRTFTSQHFLKVPDKPNLNSKTNMIIYQSKVNPPHFKVIFGNDIWDVPKGRNNMFQAVLLFLHFIKTKDGMLDRVSLGMSGINILWVLDD